MAEVPVEEMPVDRANVTNYSSDFGFPIELP